MDLQPSRRPAPRHWTPLLDPEDLRGLAGRSARRVASRGLTPVAATVTGSRLRGVDRAASDVDVLVLVSERVKAKTLKETVDPVTGLPVEGQVQSLDSYLSLLNSSVPYVEALVSPVLLVHPAVGPLLRLTVPGSHVLTQHAQRFAHHAATRAQCPPHKAANHAHAAHAVATGRTALLDRAQALPGSPTSNTVADWLDEYAAHRRRADLLRGVDRPDDLPRVLAVTAYLRTGRSGAGH